MADGVFVVPTEAELSNYFGSEPVSRSVADGYWCYEIEDARGVLLRFSFNVFERSVQTTLAVGRSNLTTVVCEGADSLRIDGPSLRCAFSTAGTAATLVLRVNDGILVDWASLRSS